MSELIGQYIVTYEIVAVIGRGGMGQVYRARQRLGGRVGRDVALKLIDRNLASTDEFTTRFEREAHTLVTLSYPHILKAFDYGQYEGTSYLVMELLTGGSLADRILNRSLSLPDVCRLLEQIGKALDYAHRRGVIHRDLKPQNILLDEDGNAFLTDFGIVKMLSETTALTDYNSVLGSPSYMAPEQWAGGKIDNRTDLYALGVMLFEMLGGRVPFLADTPFRVMYMHTNEMPPLLSTIRLDLPSAVNAVINKALAKNPDDRYQTGAALVADLNAALGQKLSETMPISTTSDAFEDEDSAAVFFDLPASAGLLLSQSGMHGQTSTMVGGRGGRRRLLGLAALVLCIIAAVIAVGIILVVLRK